MGLFHRLRPTTLKYSYTDAKSKINLYRKIINFFNLFLVIEAICFFMELTVTIRTGNFVSGISSVLLGAISLAILNVVWKCKWKIEQLKNENSGIS